jgi:SAM-dependent methyltransferase
VRLYEDRGRAGSFGADAERYDRVRPGYPSELVDHLLLDRPRSVLDVGCGTGIAGSLFLARGLQVLGVEPDARMAQLARRRGLEVEIATFEDWSPGARRFDLLTCGQAWHWIDPRRGAEVAASVLAPGGTIGLFWNFGSPPPPLREQLPAIYARLEPELERYSVLLGNTDGRVQQVGAALAASGRFSPPQVRTWTWTRRYTTSLWTEQLLTHSDQHALAPDRRAALLAAVGDALERIGGVMEMTYETRLVSARRLSASDSRPQPGAEPRAGRYQG